MTFTNILHFSQTVDYVPIFIGAILTDAIAISLLIAGQFKSNSLKRWYREFTVGGLLADVFSISIGVILARFLYPFFFSTDSLLQLALLAVGVQLVHDTLFSALFWSIPRGNSRILDIFKDYGKEGGAGILLVDSAMMISTVLIASYLASNLSVNANIILLIVSIYVILYLLYSV
jgi:hypothetical protein